MRTGSRAALALALCCTAAAALTGCGGTGRDGFVAVGAAAPGPERGAGEKVAPQDPVEFQSLPSDAPASSSASASASSSTSPGATGPPVPGGSAQGGATTTGPGGSAADPGTPPDPAAPPPQGGAGGAGGSGGSTGGSGGSGGSGGTSATPGPTGPTGPAGPKPGTTPPAPPPPAATPAALALGTPARAAASERWCERVTVTFTNTGSTAARSGTVSFATHIIGALGVDWATITTTQPLPTPIPGNASRAQTYTVCVESWRVPLGMRVETRKVTATWS
ncbi:hypothetical protein ACIRP0_29895 [Streptomyces sp. NPDC101733]|uniref:hypothetical protein n=1 Tax=unclassified Streptomyces TaxID=2593676 RepID=UPI0037F96B41